MAALAPAGQPALGQASARATKRATARSWKVLAGQAAGSRKAGRGCDDAMAARELSVGKQNFWLAAVADGAGSASHGGHGARVAADTCLRALQKVVRKGEAGGESASWAAAVVKSVARALRRTSRQLGVPMRELATTLSCTVAGPAFTWVLQVGDGAVVWRPMPADAELAAASGQWHVAVWPARGEYANSTHFVTDDEVQSAAVWLPASQCIALMTDGLGPLALDLAAKKPFAPFFDGVARELQRQEPHALQSHFVAMLGSPRVADRTDDDVTLIVALRRNPEA